MDTMIPPITHCPPHSASGVSLSGIRRTGKSGGWNDITASQRIRVCEPEVRMWRAAILQMLRDLTLSGVRGADQVAKAEAERFFFHRPEALAVICDYAQISPEAVRRAARSILLSATSEPSKVLRNKRRRTHANR
jgi:hypothetical protein